MLLLALLTAQTAGAQDLSALKVFTEVPTVTSGQSSNWNDDMENGENYNKLVDGNTSTKYGLSYEEPWVEFHYAQPITPNGYALWTANDEEGKRNPKSWTIKAKNAVDSDWTTLVSVDNSSGNKLPMANNTETRFALQNGTAYQYFRFEATRNADTGQFQLAELQFLYTDDPTKLQFAGISGISSRYAYTGEAIPVTFNVAAANGTALTLGTHFTATLGETSLASNTFSVTNEGSYTLTITAKDGSGYSGSTSKTFSVVGMKAIKLPSVAHGTVTATVCGEPATQAVPGDKVTINVEWEEGYEFGINGLTDANGNNVEKEDRWIDNSCIITFTMPETAVTFDATISEKPYWIYVPSYGEKFSITANPSPATKESVVTLTISKAVGVTMSNLKASYRDKSGSSVMNARRRALRDEDPDDEYTRYLELTKVSETQYTFTMPAADVSVKCDVSYTGQYAISRAEGLPEEALRFTVSGIEVTSANAGDEVWLNYSGSASNISVMGASTGNAVTLDGDHFTMPTEAVTVSAVFKYQLFYRTENSYPLTATANGEVIPAWGGEESYIAPGTEVTLTAKSSDETIFLSELYVGNDLVPLSEITESSEDGYPHVYTHTFTMPYRMVEASCSFGNPMTVSFAPNGGTGTMDAITIGQGGRIYLPECGFTAPKGYTFAGWTFSETDPERLFMPGEKMGLPWKNVTFTAQWTPSVYTITYNGVDDATFATATPATYTIESEAITLVNPTRDGYTFEGWTGTGLDAASKSVTIATGSTGDREYTATWKKLMTNADIAVSIPSQEWTGSELTPAITVKDGETTLTQNTDYTVTAPSSTIQDAGDYTFTIIGAGNYSGETTAKFTITPKTVTNSGIENTGSDATITLTQDQNGTMATLDGASEGSVTIKEDVEVNDVKLGRTFNNGQKTAICWPFEVSAEQAAALGTFYEFKGINTEGKIEMKVVSTDLAANTPYIFEPSGDKVEIDFGAKTLKAGGPASVGSGFTYKGIYSRVRWTTDDTDPLYNAELANELGRAYGFALETKTDLNGLKTYSPGQFVKLGEGAHSRPFRAYMVYDGAWDGNEPTAAARRINSGTSLPKVIDVVWLSANGQATGISTLQQSGDTDAWYSLDGRRLSGKPAKKGMYINNGKKVIIK